MALNIKSDEADSLAREVAALTGESITTAVTIALRDRRDRLARKDPAEVADRLREIGRRAAPLMEKGRESLYDDDGLFA